MANAITSLVKVEDADFTWMLEPGTAANQGLLLPPGGVDEPSILCHVRAIVRGLRKAGCSGGWMVVSNGEVVGLCSYKRPPKDGQVEIGYGMARSRWGRGHATRAVSALLAAAEADPEINVVLAQTVLLNTVSARVLEKNGFQRTGSRMDAKDGETIMWRRVVSP